MKKVIGEYAPDLKPCPFCGTAPKVEADYDPNSNGPDQHYMDVRCDECDFFLREDYVERWESPYYRNGRPTTKEQQAQIVKDNENRRASQQIFSIRDLEKKWNRRA